MDIDAVHDLFAGVMPVRLRRMFGGLGVYDGDLMFALVADGEIYFKAGAEEQPLFAAAGSKPFTYDRQGKPTSLGYWTLPDEAFEDVDALKRWTGFALAAARRKAAAKPLRRRGSALPELPR
jgi:DNA transformation protein